ncbi:MAG: hypothetical protein WBB82_02645 [Limnothrix sp.]
MSQADPQVTLARLRETIAQLQGVVAALEAENKSLTQTALDSVVADTAILVQQLQQVGDRPAAPTITPSIDITETDWDDDLFGESPSTTKTKPSTAPTSAKTPLRRRPQKPWWQEQKIFIGAAAAAIAFIFIWKFTTVPAPTELVATQPAETTEIAPDPVANTPAPIIEQPKSETPVTPKPVPAAKPAPPTPEQRLIAAIQSQLDDVTQPYGDNIVRAIEPNFAASTLKITVGDGWYLLKEGLQDRLGADVLKLAQLLDFKTMRVEDLEGNFVARNPVVGKALVIMRRYQTFGEE